jgi:hypothetical protein
VSLPQRKSLPERIRIADDGNYADRYPCVRSGYCCTKAPCPYGEVKSPTDHSCRFLEPGDEIAPGIQTFRCGQFEWIMANVPERDWKISPAFGAGCSSTLFNTARDAIVGVLKTPK